ncbi:glycosyltransferase [Roseimaritima sediminicola]|uniref:glycosyltransferase n=1 Tax=Roseimaritima sediminicola TaxID=2662066 RepID=UPI001298303B|nr:glycosyltransferase [Roseimaritima sediminicola]
MHICFVSTQTAWGGGETYLQHLAAGLRADGHEVRFAAPRHSPLAEQMRDDGYDVFAFRGRGRSPRTIWRLRRELRRFGADVVHCNDSHSLTLGGMAAAGLPQMKTIAMRHTMFPVRSPRRYHRLADRVIGVSHAVADRCVCDGIRREHISVVHVGIPTPTVDEHAVARLRHSLCQDGQQLAVAVGNLVPCKGHAALVDAVDRLNCQGYAVVLAIAGEGSERAGLEQKIASLRFPDRIHLLGFRDDPHQCLAAADVVVHPAFEEGLCLTVVAAMMLQRPVVASAVGGLREVIAASSATAGHSDTRAVDLRPAPLAVVCEPGRADSIAAGVQTLLQPDPRRADFLRQAYRHATEHFGVEPMVRRTVDVYRSL